MFREIFLKHTASICKSRQKRQEHHELFKFLEAISGLWHSKKFTFDDFAGLHDHCFFCLAAQLSECRHFRNSEQFKKHWVSVISGFYVGSDYKSKCGALAPGLAKTKLASFWQYLVRKLKDEGYVDSLLLFID